DLPSDHHSIDVDVAFDHGVVPEVEAALGVNITVQFSIESHLAGKLEGALQFNVRIEDVLRVITTIWWCVHSLVCACFFTVRSFLRLRAPDCQRLFSRDSCADAPQQVSTKSLQKLIRLDSIYCQEPHI